MHTIFDLPSPLNAALLDGQEPLTIRWVQFRRIAVDEAHDALGVADEFPDTTYIEAVVGILHGMNLHQVITQRIRTLEIRVLQFAGLQNSFEVICLRFTLAVVGKGEEFCCFAQGHGGAVTLEGGYIDRTNMSRQRIERAMIPEQALSSV